MSTFFERIKQNTPPVTLNLIIINIIMFLLQITVFREQNGESVLYDWLALHHYKSEYFKPFQLFTCMFLHANFFHLLFNMFALYSFGVFVERYFTSKRFLFFYLFCGIFSSFVQVLFYAYEFWGIDHRQLSLAAYDEYQNYLRQYITMGASGAIMGVVVAFGMLFPNQRLFIMPIPFPIKAKWAVLAIIIIDLFGGIAQVQGDNIAHWAHLGGAAAGMFLTFLWKKKRWNIR